MNCLGVESIYAYTIIRIKIKLWPFHSHVFLKAAKIKYTFSSQPSSAKPKASSSSISCVDIVRTLKCRLLLLFLLARVFFLFLKSKSSTNQVTFGRLLSWTLTEINYKVFFFFGNSRCLLLYISIHWVSLDDSHSCVFLKYKD